MHRVLYHSGHVPSHAHQHHVFMSWHLLSADSAAVSIDYTPPESVAPMYKALGVLPPDMPAPMSMLQKLWELVRAHVLCVMQPCRVLYRVMF